MMTHASQSQRRERADLPECPGPDCLLCNGQACDNCGAGCWNNDPGLNCQHDVYERHQYERRRDHYRFHALTVRAPLR